MIINYLKNIGYSLGIISVSTIVITLLNYFSILTGNLLNIISIVIMILTMFIGGYLTGKKASKKGYLEGIKFGIIMILIILIFNLLVFKNKFELMNTLYYFVLLVSSTIGSMIGIQKKN